METVSLENACHNSKVDNNWK